MEDFISRLRKAGFWQEAETLKSGWLQCYGCKWKGSTECRVCRRNPELPDKWEGTE